MAKKLPRRVMSMSKRVNKTAEDAADLDLLGGDAAANKPPVSTAVQVGAFTLIIVALIATIMIVRLVLAIPTGGTGEGAPFGVDGALSRVTPTLDAAAGNMDASAGNMDAAAVDVGRSTLASVPRSPFPTARQDTPIIMAVTCPDGTIQIATGDRIADTVCIRGVLITGEGGRASVGGTDVPNELACEEDEVIGFVGIPDTLVCVHYESIADLFGGIDTPTVSPTPTPTMPVLALPDAGRG